MSYDESAKRDFGRQWIVGFTLNNFEDEEEDVNEEENEEEEAND